MSQSVDCLLSMHKAQDSIPAQYKPGVVLAICNLSTHEAERGARGLRHCSVVSSNTALPTGDPISEGVGPRGT